MKERHFAFGCCFLLGGLAVSVAAAQIYKWVDSRGTVHFSSNPPPHQTGRRVEVIPTDEPAPRLVHDGVAEAAGGSDEMQGLVIHGEGRDGEDVPPDGDEVGAERSSDAAGEGPDGSR